MTDVRHATSDDIEVVAGIAAAAFHEDPLMSWVFPDISTRQKKLLIAFLGLAQGFLPEGGTVHAVEESSASFWRAPDYDYGPEPTPEPGTPSPFEEDEVRRFEILGAAMAAAHPHDTPHWYLNVLGTIPERQGTGLGARVLEPVLTACDAEGIPAYLESSNPRNIPFYQRQGFVLTGEIVVDGGPSLYPMWREPGTGSPGMSIGS